MLQLGKVGLVGIVVRRGLPGQIEHVPDKHRAYGMNGVVPIKPFVHKPLCRALHWDLVTKRNLIFDNGMHHGVDLGVRQTDTRPAVIDTFATRAGH